MVRGGGLVKYITERSFCTQPPNRYGSDPGSSFRASILIDEVPGRLDRYPSPFLFPGVKNRRIFNQLIRNKY